VGKREGKRPLGTPRRRCQDIIEKYFETEVLVGLKLERYTCQALFESDEKLSGRNKSWKIS